MSARRFRRVYRLVVVVVAAAVAGVLLVALMIQFRIRVANDWQMYAKLPAAKAPTKAESIIVFAPHADDETLGCGGLLAIAHENGAKVRVVLMTNGDGFWFAASRTYETIRLTPDRFISFACRRQTETLKALAIDGIGPSQVTFLGYPDRGLSPLWSRYWSSDKLYTSKSTKLDYSPYANSLTSHAPYCGESVLKDVGTILKQTKPTDIYVPHPLDNHPDHYATYCFVVAAIEQLRSEGYAFAGKIKTHTYLVHRGDWPAPRGECSRLPLAPPHAMTGGDTKWESLALPAGIVRLKLRAIKQYKTQANVEKGFLMSFARSNELFGSMPDRTVSRVAPGAITVDGAIEDWQGIPPAVVDPVGDYVVAGMSRGGDVRAIYVCADSANLYIRIDCVRNLSPRIRYTVSLRGINGHGSDSYYTVSIKPRTAQSTGSSDWAYRANVMEIALPLRKLRMDDNLFIQVQTSTMRLAIDNTGWHGLNLKTPKTSGKPVGKRPV